MIVRVSPAVRRMWFSLLLLLSLALAQEATTLRRSLSAFTITLSPIVEPLTVAESTTVRDTVEILLASYFQNSVQWEQGTSVEHLGLTRVLENTLEGQSAVQVTMDGLLYFSDGSNPPGTDVLDALAAFALTPDALLNALAPDFPQLDSVFLDSPVPLDPPTEAPQVPPTEAPQAAPTNAPQRAPTQAPVNPPPPPVASPTTPTTQVEPTAPPQPAPANAPNNAPVVGVQKPTSQPSDPEPISSNNTGTIVGAIVGGLAVILAALALVLRQRRNKLGSTMDEDAWRTDVVHKQRGLEVTSPSKTALTDFSASDVESPEIVLQQQQPKLSLASQPGDWKLMMNQTQTLQMIDDDDTSGSALDFNIDDLSSDFDDTTQIQPHIIAVRPVESFQQQRQHVLKKDMLQSNLAGNQLTPNPYLASMYNDDEEEEYDCALAPTDVSAATLAREAETSKGTSSLVPKLSWWRNRGPPEEVSEPDANEYIGSDWDPDDVSMGDTKSAVSDIFDARVENKDEQSLLNHSLKNESYKMQRLRTPPEAAVAAGRDFEQPPSLLDRDDSSSSSYDSTMMI